VVWVEEKLGLWMELNRDIHNTFSSYVLTEMKPTSANFISFIMGLSLEGKGED
jgi:hypothetical protein